MDSNYDSFSTLLESDYVENLDETTDTNPTVASANTGEAVATSNKGKRSKNFTKEEDVILISSWLNTSKNAVIGVEQPFAGFWKEIHSKFIEFGGLATRTRVSLISHYREINKATGNWVGHFNHIEGRSQSGKTELDKTYRLGDMDPDKAEVDTRVHVVALPYPGRGHINPMMNLCDQLLSKDDKILITFVVTEEWLGFLSGGSEPPNFNFRTIPNVVPSELVRAADIIGFVDAVLANMEAPFEQLLDRLEPPATMILFDFVLFWVVGVGNRRNIPVASFWTMSAMVFSVFHHFPLLQQNGHYPIGDLSDKGGEVVDYIPGVSPTSLEDLPTVLRHGPSHQSYHTQAFAQISNSQYLLLATVSELESQAIQVLKRVIPIPVYSIGPSIPYPKLKNTTSSSDTDYIQWLEKQSCNSVLYISMGSFLSLGRAQIDEISAGLRISRVPYLWIARDETPRLIKDGCNGEKGLVVPWCDQLRVLSHSSVGGFWTHCGWSSTLEGVLAGVPFLTLPLIMDQLSNSKLIVEDWNVGWKVKKRENNNNGVVYRNDIAELVKRFMDLESDEAKMMRGRARKLRELCQQAIRKGGSSEENISTFVRDIFQHSYP